MRGPPDAPRLRESQSPTVEAGVSRTNRAVIAPETLDALVAVLRAARLSRARADGPRRRDRLRRARRRRPSCRSAGPTARTAAPTGSSGATTRRASATRSGRTRGSSSSSRRASGSGGRAGTATARSTSRRSRSTRRRSRSSASARASCTRSRSRTASSSAARIVDRDYAARREGAFVVAVNCFEPGGTCFCVSMGTGPEGRGRATTSR